MMKNFTRNSVLICLFLFLQNALSAQPAAPTLSTPSDGSSFQILGTRLVWNVTSGATYYNVKIATDSQFTNLVYSKNNLTTTAQVVTGLQYNTTYFWNVQAGNIKGLGTPSAVWKFKTMPDNPNAVTSHPRLLITQNDISKLRSWAVSSNPVFVSLQTALNTAISNYNTKFFPGGVANTNWPDYGGITWPAYVTESYAEFFAFWSLIDTNAANRILHAKRARNLLMYVIDSALLGPATGVAFRDPQFMTYDRSRIYGEGFPLTVDWIYDAKDAANNPILSAADKAKIRTVFMMWCNDQLTAYNHPVPIGLYSDKKNAPDKSTLNNYYSGHARNLTLMSLAMDAADDTLIDSTIHFSALGNSLRSYIYNAMGSWLYLQYAMYERPEIVSKDYGIAANTPNLGLGSGGLSVEGSLYGSSIGFVLHQLIALKTAGWADENIIGKQAKLITSEYWTRFMDGLIHGVAPAPITFPTATYYGPVYQMACYGDLLRTWITPEIVNATGALGILDMIHGNHADRLDQSRWYSRNILEGGPTYLSKRITNIWPGSNATAGITYFLFLDPAGSDPSDPRSKMNLNFWDPAFGRALSRTEWNNNCSWFDWQCHWTTINHQSGDNNQFEFYRKGEWLVKERSGYTNDGIGYTSAFHNTLAIENDVPSNLQWYEQPTSQRGGQWTNGNNAGDPKVVASYGKNYFYGTGDATNLYNRPNPHTPSANATDVEHASRSIFWMKPDHIVIYDRAKTKTSNRFKRFYLQFVAPATLSGKNALVKTPKGQKLFISNLLPASSVLAADTSEMLDVLAQFEPTTHQLRIEDPSNPTSIRFLNVLQGADSSVIQDSVSLVQSVNGEEFEGAVVGKTAVLFPKEWGKIFTSTGFFLPSKIKEHFVTGLTANGSYSVSQTVTGTTVKYTITPSGSVKADSGGVLTVLADPLSIDETKVLSGFEVFPCRPNPFPKSTIISYELATSRPISIEICDILGSQVALLQTNDLKEAGHHNLVFNGDGLTSGIYYCQISDGVETIVQKMVLLK